MEVDFNLILDTDFFLFCFIHRLCIHNYKGRALGFFLDSKKKEKKPPSFFPRVALGWAALDLLLLFLLAPTLSNKLVSKIVIFAEGCVYVTMKCIEC